MPAKTKTEAHSEERRRSVDRREAELWRHAVGAHQRLSFLSEASRVLNETLEAEGVLQRLAQLAVPKLAHWCEIDLLDEQGRPSRAAFADADDRPGVPRPRSREDSVAVPIVGLRGVIGQMSIGRRRGAGLTPADVELARELAARAGAAIENAVLYEKARQADALLTRALSANRMVAWSWDLKTGVVERSANAPEIYGAGSTAEIGRGLHLVHPEDRARYEAVLSKAAQEGGSYVERFRMVRRDGSVSWMEEHASLTAPGRMAGVVMDITGQKLAEDQLRLQEIVSRIVAESSGVSDALPRLLASVGETMGWSSGLGWLTGGETELTAAGRWSRAKKGSGAAAEEPGPLARAVLADGEASWVCSLPQLRESVGAARQSCAFAFPLLGARGVLGVLEFRGDGPAINEDRRAELFDRLGRQIGAFLERKAAEAALESQRREQKLILDSVPAMIWYKDGRNRVLRCNRAAADWYGKPAEQIEGRTAYELFPERGAEYHRDDLTVLRTGKPRLGLVEECVSPAGARCWLRRDLIPLTDERGRATGVIIFAVDITKIKRAEQALRESERVQRDFVANVSHEFRTPVAAIKGFAETLRRGGLEDVKNRLTFVRTIESHADRLDWLVQDLLNLSRLGSGMVKLKRQPLPVQEFLDEYLASVSSLVSRSGASIETECTAGLTALADRPHLVQVFDNLLTNALKYGRSRGTIRFEARGQAGGVRLTVRDDGKGIEAEHLPRLFDRFYRVSKADGGGSSGLGLHIVKTIMEAQGGGVTVESELGRGTAFHLWLPKAR